jgi:hypothetical protein
MSGTRPSKAPLVVCTPATMIAAVATSILALACGSTNLSTISPFPDSALSTGSNYHAETTA